MHPSEPIKRSVPSSADGVQNKRLVIALSWMSSLVAKQKMLGPSLSADAPWRMLLQAYVADRDGEALTVTELGDVSGVGTSLAVRYIALLESDGWLERVGFRHGGRVAQLRLTGRAKSEIEGLMDTVLSSNRELGLGKAFLDS